MAETTKMKVLSETLPTRCEVCHQSDEYDALTNNCSRCSELKANQSNPYIDETPIPVFHSRTQALRNVMPLGRINRKFLLVVSVILMALIYFSPGIYHVAKHGFNTHSSTNSVSSDPVVELQPPIDYEQVPLAPIPERAVPYEVELNLNEPLENPPIVLAVNAVTVLDSNEPIVEVRTPNNNSIEIKQSTSSDNRLYLSGKYPVKSSNLILVSKNNVFNVYFEIRENADPGNFNVLVKVKK